MSIGKNVRSIRNLVSRSLVGHIVFFEVIFSLPFVVFGIVSNYSEGTLSVGFAIEMVAEIVAIGAVVAAAVWFFITTPLKKKPDK